MSVNHASKYLNMAKHQSKPQDYKSDIAPCVVRYKTCHRNRLQENNAYLLQSEDRKIEKQQTSTKVLSFRKYINYNKLAHAISDL